MEFWTWDFGERPHSTQESKIHAVLNNCFRAARRVLFQRELAERTTEDVLDRALLRAHNSKLSGVLAAPEYYRIAEKVDSLKKLRFTEDYEKLQDPDTYEWMKYKVAAEVGGSEERAEFKLYEKTKRDEVGEVKFRLFAQKVVDDPVFARYRIEM